MHLVAGDELAEMLAELVVGIGRDMVELVHGDQPVVERLDAELVDGEAEGRMGADQHLVVAFEERADRIDLAAVVAPGALQRFHFGSNGPVGPEAELGQRLVVEARADGSSPARR